MGNNTEKIDKIFKAYFRAIGHVRKEKSKIFDASLAYDKECDSVFLRNTYQEPKFTCPSDEQLSSYIDGTLEDSILLNHIERCRKCRDRVKIAREAIESNMLSGECKLPDFCEKLPCGPDDNPEENE